jgi:hypothetical protein|tara:strand:- start:38 stop:634 length:597 start_codon:yes stop_codon:yes gene_type:complete
MANRNSAGFGFVAAGTLGNTPSSQGLSEYFIDAGDSANKFNGMAVRVTAGYIVTGEDSATGTTVGVLNGIFYNAATTLKPTFANAYIATITPANSEDIKAFVNDNPFQLYNVAADAAVATTVVGAHAIVLDTFDVNTGGSTTTGRSNTTIDIGDTHATNNTWRLVRSAEDPENNDLTAAFCTVVVIQNLNEYIDSTGA